MNSRTRFVPVREFVLTFGATALGLIFVYSAIVKLNNPLRLLTSVYDYQILGQGSGLLVAAYLPYLEIILGICLVGRIFLPGILAVSTMLLGLFAVAQVSVVLRGLHVDCGCFSFSGTSGVGVLTIARTLVLTGIGALGIYCCIAPEKGPGTISEQCEHGSSVDSAVRA